MPGVLATSYLMRSHQTMGWRGGQNLIKPAGLALCLFSLALIVPLSALAQANEIAPLVDRLQRLERDISLLQRQVYSGKVVSPNSVSPSVGGEGAAVSPASVQSLPNSAIARMERRFADLEEQLRRLTGMIEEVGHRVDKTGDHLQTVNSDTQVRLSTLENQLRSLGVNPIMPPTDGAVVAGIAQDGVLGQLRVPVGPDDSEQTSAADVADNGEKEPLLPPGPPKEQYDFAVGLLWNADYIKAEDALRAFMKVNPDSVLVANAQYWLGETYYVRKNYTKAAVIFAEGYKNYRDGQKAPDFLLKLALSLSRIDESEQACKALSELGRVFPNATSAIKSRAMREQETLGCPTS